MDKAEATGTARTAAASEEVELGENAKDAAGKYQSATAVSVILVSIALAFLIGHLAQGETADLIGGFGGLLVFIILLPFWMKARAYTYDLRRRQRFMDRN